MGNSEGSCFRIDEYYFFSDTTLRYCERFAFNDHEYLSSFSALAIALIGFYSLFFYQHNIPLLRFISSSLMFNGIFSFLNHWNGQREWLFMDNLSVLIPVYLLLMLTITQFIQNYDCVRVTDTEAPPEVEKVASISAFQEFSRSVSVEQEAEATPNNAADQIDNVSRPIATAFGWIICLLLIFFVIVYNMNGCDWQQIANQNVVFILFVLVFPLFIWLLLALFYLITRANDRQIGMLYTNATECSL